MWGKNQPLGRTYKQWPQPIRKLTWLMKERSIRGASRWKFPSTHRELCKDMLWPWPLKTRDVQLISSQLLGQTLFQSLFSTQGKDREESGPPFISGHLPKALSFGVKGNCMETHFSWEWKLQLLAKLFKAMLMNHLFLDTLVLRWEVPQNVSIQM